MPENKIGEALTGTRRSLISMSRASADEADISESCTVHLRDPRGARTHVFFGRYDFLLRREDGAWRIAIKKILLLNDVISTMVDCYCV